jgi:uncharacterized membrane protein
MLIIICMISLIVGMGSSFAHGKKHKAKNDTLQTTDSLEKVVVSNKDTLKTTTDSLKLPDRVNSTLHSFPTLHPLVVHFPIVLLMVAPGFLLLGWFLKKEGLFISSFFTSLGGFTGAFVSSNLVHPHTATLPEAAQEILLRHELWAGWTIGLSGFSILLFVLAYFYRSRRNFILILAFIVIALSAIFVSLAGHEGAKLTHLHGVGPQGKYLEMEH